METKLMLKETKILMIDDDEEDFMIVRDIINEINHHKYTIDWASSYEEGLKLISEKQHDIYLVDYRIGALTGLELIKKAIEIGCDAPLIIQTGQNDLEIDTKVMKAGAADFLVKGTLSAESLERSIRYSISNHKQLKEIIRLNTYLEKRVADRTIILEEAIKELNKTKDELSESLKTEKELNELKSRFVSMASHEFRTPLATILSSLSLVALYGEKNDKEKQTKHINRIKSSITHLTDILNDVLSLSKLEEGIIIFNPEKINIKEFFSHIVKEVEGIVKEGQEIIITHSGNTDAVIDKKNIRHVLLNLLSNAIKFTPEGKRIELNAIVSDKEIEIIVKDNGIGISEDDQKYLFQRFFRASNASSIQGTGLGLSIVSKYIEMHNGTIECESVLDEGTKFTIKLPNN